MTQRLVVVGAGGMAHCILDLIDEINERVVSDAQHGGYEVLGVVADPEPADALLAERGVKYLGAVSNLVEGMDRNVEYVIGIGDPRVRRRLDMYVRAHNRKSATIVHPNVHMGYNVQVGEGSVICSHVSIENHVSLGRHVHVNQNSTLGHNTVLGDWTTISPLVAVSGHVTAGDAVFVGTGASIRQHTRLAAESTIGMGSAVLDDVVEGVTVVGVPARPRHQRYKLGERSDMIMRTTGQGGHHSDASAEPSSRPQD